MAPAFPRSPPAAVLFDAGNTLVQIDYAAIAAFLVGRAHAVTEASVREAEILARVRLDPHLATRASTEGADTHVRYLRYVLDHLGITDDAEFDAIDAWRRAYNRPLGLWCVADPKAEAALARVRRAGLRSGVISNSSGVARRILESVGLAAHVDFVVDSGIVGVEKPDRRIFELALREAGVTAAEAIYIGDLYSVDVLGARAAGLDAILLDPLGAWGERDCRRARGVLDAVALVVGES
jgi:putative hydrolase of the HAD superfamily